jgi:hypothetical protein
VPGSSSRPSSRHSPPEQRANRKVDESMISISTQI